MEPVLTCFHYNYPQSIAFLIKITNNEILLKIIPHGWYPCPLILKQSFTAYWVLCLFLSLPISQSRKVGRQTDKGKKKSDGKQREKPALSMGAGHSSVTWPWPPVPCPLRSPLGQSWGSGSSWTCCAPGWASPRPCLGRAAPGSLASPYSPSQQCYLPDETSSESATRFRKDWATSLLELSPSICSRYRFDLFTLRTNSTGTCWWSINI